MKTLLLIIILIRFFYSCNITGDCNNYIHQVIDNPSRTHKLVIFDRGCGATTNGSIQISLLPISDSLSNDEGNVFISNPTGAVIPSWVNDKTILIKYDTTVSIFKQDSIVKEFKIIYSRN